MNHRFTRDKLTVGAHQIVVAQRDPSPNRTYQAVCKTCTFESAIGKASVADKAALAHRDENIEDYVTDQLGDILTPTAEEIAAARVAPTEEAKPLAAHVRSGKKR